MKNNNGNTVCLPTVYTVRWEAYAYTEIKRTLRVYRLNRHLPDFKIWNRKDSEPYFIEIKGYMDQVSRTKLKRMKKYYPEIRVDLVQAKQYYEIKRKLSCCTCFKCCRC